MNSKYIPDRRGETYFCKCCKSCFFIPLIYLEAQRKIGCPICNKNLWKRVSYVALFIKDTSKLSDLKREKQLTIQCQGVWKNE